MPAGGYILLGFTCGAILFFLVGWIGGSRRPGTAVDHRIEEELRQQLQAKEREVVACREESTLTKTALATAEARRETGERLLAEQKINHEKTAIAAATAQQQALQDLREAFRSLSAEALKQTQPDFLRLANETLGKFQETAKGELTQRQEAIKTLVEPLKQQLETYQTRLQQSESQQSTTLGEVKKQLEALATQSQSLSNETLQL